VQLFVDTCRLCDVTVHSASVSCVSLQLQLVVLILCHSETNVRGIAIEQAWQVALQYAEHSRSFGAQKANGILQHETPRLRTLDLLQ
jgi:hypothetical protein